MMLNVIMQRTLKYALQAFNRRATHGQASKRHWYFAFGANMDADLLAKKSIFAQSSIAARLDSYRIEMTSPCEYRGKGFASIAAKSDATVFGVLHEVSRIELMILDTLEWVPFNFHERIKIEVKTIGDDNPVAAWAYVAKNPKTGLKTSQSYRDLLVRSAKKYDFPEMYIEELSNLPVASSFDLDAGFRLSNPAKRRWLENTLTSLYRIHDLWREKLCQRLP